MYRNQRSTEDLELSAERLRNFIQKSTETIWCVDLEEPVPLDLPEEEQLERVIAHAFISEANDAWARQVGYERGEELVGIRIGELMPISEPENLESLQNLIRARFRLEDFETAEYVDDGPKRFVVSSCNPVIENDCLVRAWGTARDITVQRHAELDARELHEKLAQLDRIGRLGQLAGAIAHELNQSLTGILSNAQAGELMLSRDELDPSEASELLADIVSDAKRARDVLTSLRGLFRQQETELVELDANELIRDTLAFLNSDLVLSSVAVSTELPREPVRVRGNRVQLQQLLINVISNAKQAMQSTSLEERTIRVSSSRESGHVRVSIEDGGPGIDSKRLNEIFEPLKTSKSGGLGMGLAICRSIVEAHGGRIWAANAANGGAEISFTMPTFNPP